MPRNTYLALGDAISAGQGASQPNLGFARHVGRYLKNKSIAEHTLIVAQPGWTAKTLFQVASTLRPSIWDEVQVITLCQGSADFSRLIKPRRLSLNGNLFPLRSVVKKADEFGFHTDQLFRLVESKKIPHVLVLTLYNPFPSFEPANEFIEGMNSIIRDCASHYRFPIVDVDKQFANNEAYLIERFKTGGVTDLMTPLPKPILPNNAGHRLIAELVNQRLTHLLTKKRNIRSPKRRAKPSVQQVRRQVGRR